jgi:hypothetical protein
MNETLIQRMIVRLREECIKVTIHDIGADNCVFVLTVVVDGPETVWDTALILMDYAPTPKWEGSILFFPELIVDAETYEYICA